MKRSACGLLAAAFSTESRILVTMDSESSFSTLIFKRPEVLTQPDVSWLPTFTDTGTGSPVIAGVTYLNFNGCGVQFLQWSFTLPYAVYLLLIVILIWASINVVNCTDGVDGLSASLAVVTIGTYLIAYHEELADYSTAGVVFMGALLAYLWSNAKPSTLLMGDAGSRAMGFFIAILSLKCGHPFAFLLAAIVFIVDGSLGILKISLKRFLHISILKNTRTPLHDHVRKNKGWSDEQVVARWLILQCVASALLLLVVHG